MHLKQGDGPTHGRMDCYVEIVCSGLNHDAHELKVRLLGVEFERLPYRFAVVPLSEDCGFIEWVPQTVTLRNVCTEVYVAEGLTDMKSTLASVHSTYKNFSVSPLACSTLPNQYPPQSCAPQAAWHDGIERSWISCF